VCECVSVCECDLTAAFEREVLGGGALRDAPLHEQPLGEVRGRLPVAECLGLTEEVASVLGAERRRRDVQHLPVMASWSPTPLDLQVPHGGVHTADGVYSTCHPGCHPGMTHRAMVSCFGSRVSWLGAERRRRDVQHLPPKPRMMSDAPLYPVVQDPVSPGFRVQGSRFRAQGKGSGCRVQGLGGTLEGCVPSCFSSTPWITSGCHHTCVRNN